MNRSRYNNQRPKRSRDPLERRMDQFVESSRQFVDGVAGNRPGQRRKANRNNMNNMGRWVGEKIDWFFEDEDDWTEAVKSRIDLEEDVPIKKRPLTAISLRVPKALTSSTHDNSEALEEWPDDSSFRVEKWQRNDPPQSKELNKSSELSFNDSPKNPNVNRRPLPRSSRKRN